MLVTKENAAVDMKVFIIENGNYRETLKIGKITEILKSGYKVKGVGYSYTSLVKWDEPWSVLTDEEYDHIFKNSLVEFIKTQHCNAPLSLYIKDLEKVKSLLKQDEESLVKININASALVKSIEDTLEGINNFLRGE